jgi:hypothetical protein
MDSRVQTIKDTESVSPTMRARSCTAFFLTSRYICISSLNIDNHDASVYLIASSYNLMATFTYFLVFY